MPMWRKALEAGSETRSRLLLFCRASGGNPNAKYRHLRTPPSIGAGGKGGYDPSFELRLEPIVFAIADLPMPQMPLQPALDALGLKQGELAALLGVHHRSVSGWARDAKAIPGPVAGYLRLLQAATPEMRKNEFERLADRRKQLDEGVYRIAYTGAAAGDVERGGALAVLRNGRIFGADPHGRVFTGTYDFDPLSSQNLVHLRLQVPPGGVLVNGVMAGRDGTAIDIACTVLRPNPISSAVVNVAGEPVAFEFTFVGPLPH